MKLSRNWIIGVSEWEPPAGVNFGVTYMPGHPEVPLSVCFVYLGGTMELEVDTDCPLAETLEKMDAYAEILIKKVTRQRDQFAATNRRRMLPPSPN